MLGKRLLPFVVLIAVAHSIDARAQQPSTPWTGVVANDARSDIGQTYGFGSNDTWRESISGDGRFVVFHSSIASLVAGDTNNWNDVFLRDRSTGALSRVSIASDGTQANHMSAYPVISRNGRHIAFQTCATNLDPNDTNERCDIYVHDRGTGATVRVNLGPNGEQNQSANTYFFSLSADGRFVAFGGSFTSSSWTDNKVWLRDRDPDENGVFDEAGLATTALIMESAVGSDQLWAADAVAISGDGRFIAYSASAVDANFNQLGSRMYVHDRITAMTFRVDRPLDDQDVQAYASGPHFSDEGQLVYSSNAPNLVPGDPDLTDDVFVFNLYTGGNERIRLTHENAPMLAYEWAPSISADGRYVAFMGAEVVPPFALAYNAYAFDRQTGMSYEISVWPNGSRDNTIGTPWISADGSAIAFSASAAMLVDGWGNNGVFVATNVALSPTDVDVPEAGGTFDVELTVPVNVAWTVPTQYLGDVQVAPSSGVGPTTLQVSVPGNNSGDERTFSLTLGSEQVLLHQASAAQVYYVMPWSGSTSGGTAVEVHGAGFAAGATVTFGGTPATDVVVVDSENISAVAPAHASGPVTVAVTNPNGLPAAFDYGFWYMDVTPPVITPTITGTRGLNDWFISDVSVTWTVQDDESPIDQQYCYDYSRSTDVALEYAICWATSGGGEAVTDIAIKRDATPPTVDILSPEPRTYTQGEQLQVWFSCMDDTSSIASCTGPQANGAQLNTSAVGTFDFMVTAEDYAGHRTTRTVSYTVKAAATLSVPAVTAPYAGVAQLRATLAVSGLPLAGGTVAFFVDGQPVGTSQTSGSGEANFALALAGRNAGTYLLHVEFAGDATTMPYAADSPLTIEKATPVISWPTPAAIAEGTPLGAGPLSATTTVDGFFTFTPEYGTVLPAGTHTLSATFTPYDTTNYNSASKSVTLSVKAVPVITWATPPPLSYPLSVSFLQLNATANVAGTFSYTPAAGTQLPAGTHVLTATFTPTNTANYVTTTATVTLEVLKGSAWLEWPSPTAIVYGTPLGSAQLNADAFPSGAYTYAPPAGTVLPAGTHSLSVTFTPSDPDNFESATASVSLVVTRRYPPVWWSDPAPIVYGTPLSGTQLNAYSTIPGTFTYDPPAGAVLNAGTQRVNLTFTPDDTANNHVVTFYKDIVVQSAATTVTWANPAPIVYGTTLGAAQLNATANVPGAFTYTPAAGTQLAAGTHSLYVWFVPTDSSYASSGKYVSIVVQKRTPVITWSNPAPIVYGTALGWTQYTATVNVGGGGFSFDPPLGTVLNAGAGQTLRATYEPSDPWNYNSASATVTIDVLKVTPIVSWPAPAGITYGTVLSTAQLNATASVAGAFSYSPTSGSVLNAGTHVLSVSFTPANAGNYNATSATTSISVTPAALTVGANDTSKVYGADLPAFAAIGTGFVNGDSLSSLNGALSFATSATATSAPGSYSVTPSGVSSPNYAIAFSAGKLTVTKASTSLSLTSTPNPSSPQQNVQVRATVSAVAPGAGTATGSVEFRDNGVLLGTAPVVSGVATITVKFKKGSHPLTATYAGDANFNGSSGARAHQTN